MSDRLDDLTRELEKHIDTELLAEHIADTLRKDQASGLTVHDFVRAFQAPPDNKPAWITRFPEESTDIPKLFEFLAKIVCPPVCVGYVNSEGWHQLCEQKAQEAIRALGFTPPAITPIPGTELTDPSLRGTGEQPHD